MNEPLPRAPAPLPDDGGDAARAAALSPLGLLLSADRRVQWCNDRFCELFGYARGELVGKSLVRLYPSPVDFDRIGRRGFEVMVHSGTYADERLMRHADGSLRWFRVHGHAHDTRDPFRLASWVFEPLRTGAEVSRLSAREREVLAGMTRGLTAKESARELGLSPRTVEKLRGQLRLRYGVHNAAALMSRVAGFPSGDIDDDGARSPGPGA